MNETGKYSNILKREGLKNTKHRNAILEVIESSEQPQSAEDIFIELKENNTLINLSSVYRILDSLVSKDLIIKSNITGDSKAMYEMKRPEHKHHLICSECRRMFAIDGCPLADYEKQIKDRTGFDITGHKLEIFGLCKDCKEKKH
jgi:Fur family ferric uptake transcriptional regulator